MSRVAKNPVQIPDGVSVTYESNIVNVKGKNGEMNLSMPESIEIEINESLIQVKYDESSQQSVALAGTTRANINNMVIGVSDGFEKKLELKGVGYRAKASGQLLELTLGFSHDVYFSPPNGIEIKTTKSMITISGIDKQLVGQVAAKIRSIRPPEPFKGKGIRYLGEYVRIKKGKTVGE